MIHGISVAKRIRSQAIHLSLDSSSQSSSSHVSREKFVCRQAERTTNEMRVLHESFDCATSEAAKTMLAAVAAGLLRSKKIFSHRQTASRSQPASSEVIRLVARLIHLYLHASKSLIAFTRPQRAPSSFLIVVEITKQLKA